MGFEEYGPIELLRHLALRLLFLECEHNSDLEGMHCNFLPVLFVARIMMSKNPYSTLPSNAFWKTAVASNSMFDISGLYTPNSNLLPKQPVAAYGSCFAQHFGRALQARGYNWLRTEVAPFGLSDDNKSLFNYDVFSARTGNIYTTSLLLQWVQWATGEAEIPNEVWQMDGRFYDPFRPRIEPNGFESAEEVEASRLHTIQCFAESIRQSRVLVFTMGLTERWVNSEYGYEYPMCPGTVAGTFDKNRHAFENQSFRQVYQNLRAAIKLLRKLNPKLRIILTVSPVPLTATMSGNHVLVATSASKAILRAVAGEVEKDLGFLDYFPSFEIISNAVFRGAFYEPNQREVNPHGVKLVMDHFFAGLYAKYGNPKRRIKMEKKRLMKLKQTKSDASADIVCEEELLDAFG